MTRGSLRTSSGVPSEILLAVVEDGDPVADPHDQLHVVLDEQDREAEVAAQPRDQARSRSCRLLGVHARGGLVEQQELRVGGERPRDLEPALVAVGQVAWRARCPCPAARRARAAPRPAVSASFSSLPHPRRAEQRVRQVAVAHGVCIPTRTFSTAVMFWNRRMFWNVRPTPACDHVVGAGAAEDPEPLELLLVPDRPDDREQQRSPRAASMRDHAGREAGRRRCPLSRRRGSPRGRRRRSTAAPTRATHRDPLAGGRSSAGRWNVDLARGRVDDAQQDVEERRLAGAVGPDEADDRSFRDREVDLVDRDQAAEPAGDLARDEDGPGGCSRRRSFRQVLLGRAGQRSPARPRSAVRQRAVQLALSPAVGEQALGSAAASSRPARGRTAGTGAG